MKRNITSYINDLNHHQVVIRLGADTVYLHWWGQKEEKDASL